MAIKAMEGLIPDWFIPDSEKEEDRPAQFHIEPLNGLEYLSVMQDGSTYLDADGTLKFTVSDSGRTAILKKVLSWRNIDGPDGGNLMFSQAALRTLPTAVLAELCQEVLRVSNIAQASEKNSSSQSKLSTVREISTASDVSGEDIATPETPHPSSSGKSQMS